MKHMPTKHANMLVACKKLCVGIVISLSSVDNVDSISKQFAAELLIKI